MIVARWAFAAVAASLIVAASYAYYNDFRAESGDSYTEFYVLAPDGSTNIDTAVVIGESIMLTVGIVNHEGAARDYRLRVHLGGIEALADLSLSLENGATVETPLAVPVRSAGTKQPLQLDLFVAGQAAPYRSLGLYIDAASVP